MLVIQFLSWYAVKVSASMFSHCNMSYSYSIGSALNFAIKVPLCSLYQ